MKKLNHNLFHFYVECEDKKGSFRTIPLLARNHTDAVKKGKDTVRAYYKPLGAFLRVGKEWDSYFRPDGIWIWRKDLTEAQITTLDREAEELCEAS